MSKAPICVTGGSGFLGLHVVAHLLDQGYLVNTTTQSLSKNNPLTSLKDKYPDNLKIFEANLLRPGAYDSAFEGTSAVIHIATPVLLDNSDDEETQIKPAVDGTRNVLDSCLKCSSINSIIFTSSFVTVLNTGNKASHIYTESDFNTLDSPTNTPYFKSKIMAEKLAWDFNEQHKDRFRIVTLHPSLIFGPEVFPEYNRTNVVKSMLRGYISGETKYINNMYATLVDVRDVALAHIRALENQEAQGRFLITSDTCHWKTIIEFISKNYSMLDRLPKEVAATDLARAESTCDTSKSKKYLGMVYRSWESSVKDTMNQLI